MNNNKFPFARFMRGLTGVIFVIIVIVGGLLTVNMIATLADSPKAKSIRISNLEFPKGDYDIFFDQKRIEVSPDNEELSELSIRPETYSINIEKGKSPGYTIFQHLGILTILFAIAWTTFLMRKVLKSIVSNDFFVETNVKRVKNIGLIFIITPFFTWLWKTISTMMIDANYSIAGLDFKYSIGLDFDYIITGLLIFVIAEIFDQGAKMNEEQKLTV